MGLSIASSKNFSEEKAHKLYITLECMLKSCLQRGQNPKKLVFGSRELFEKLKKKHLTGKRREKLRQRWEERRYYYLYSRGEKSKNGSLNRR
jgi:hypothetical protein